MNKNRFLTIVGIGVIVLVAAIIVNQSRPSADTAGSTKATGIQVMAQGNFQAKETTKSRFIADALIYDASNTLVYSYALHDDMLTPTFLYDQSTNATPPAVDATYTVKIDDVNPAFTLVGDTAKSVTVKSGQLAPVNFEFKADNSTGDIVGGVQSFYGPSLKDGVAKLIVKDQSGKQVRDVALEARQGFSGVAGGLKPGDYTVELVILDSTLTADGQLPLQQKVSVKANSNTTFWWQLKTK